MCDVTRRNFEEMYPQIIDDMQAASFISIDCEFSGLFDENSKCSLFDTPKVRFKKLQSILEHYLIIQFGLSTFKYDRARNSFNASTYNFYIIPISLFKTNSKFQCLISSTEFLCKHEFDFNKFFYDGINFLNKADEAEALFRLEEMGFVNEENSSQITKYCVDIVEWSLTVPMGSNMVLEIQDEREPFVYILHQEIRKKLPNIWTYYDKKNSMRIMKVTDLEKRDLLLNNKEKDILNKKLFDSLLGFSRIIKELQNLRKPIVGHNFFIDLVMIYKQFFNPVPVSYKEFKESVTNIFPNLYDTKHISFQLRPILTRDKTWTSNFLKDLYNFFKEGKGSTLVLFTPLVHHRDENILKSDNFHEAGFDSYCTGFCFLKMAHIFSLWNEEKKSFTITSMPTTSSWLLGAVAPMKNCMNLSRAQVNYIVLDGADPKSSRPSLFHIKSKTNEPLDVLKISDIMAKYASVDIQLLNKTSGLIAVANERLAKDILQAFKNHEEFTLSKYNFLLHSDLGRAIVPSVIVISAALIAIFLSRNNFWRSN